MKPTWMRVRILRAAGAGALVLALVVPGLALAGSDDDGPRFDVTGFDLRGADPLPPGHAEAVLAPFVGPGASLARLREAVAALEAALRAQGLGLYRVALPPQALEGRVVLALEPLRLDRIEVQGNNLSSEAQVRRSLPALVTGGTPDLHQLAAQASLANDSPVRQVQVVLREGRADMPGAGRGEGDAGADERVEAGRVDARILVREQRPASLTAILSNHGSAATGRDRFTVSGRHADLAGRDIDLQASYTTSLERPQDVRQAGLSLRVPLYPLGAQLSGFVTRSDIVGDFGDFRSTGAGSVSGLELATYLATGGQSRHRMALSLQDRLFETTRIDDQLLPGQVDRRTRPLGLRYAGRLEGQPGATPDAGPMAALRPEAGQWQWAAEWLANTGSGAGNDLAAYQSEDPRVHRVRWQALRLSIANGRDLSAWRLLWRVQGQLASTALIAGEQFGLGGLNSVRGTRDERPLSGDSGWQGSVELAAPPRDGWRAVAFVDAGGIASKPAQDGEPALDRLASAGLGLRWSDPRLAVVLDWGRIITGSRVPLAVQPSAPQRGDERLYLALSFRF